MSAQPAMPQFHPDPLARWVVPVLLASALTAAGVAGVLWLQKVTSPGRLANTQPDPLGPLQPWLPGLALNVPPQPGLWADERQGTALLLQHAMPDGESQVIDLCLQRMGQRHDPDIVYPIALLPGLPAAAQHASVRNPMVLAPDAAAGLPTAQVQGRAGRGPAGVAMHLQVTDGAASGAWQVALSHQLPQVAGVRRVGEAVVHRYPVQGELWLLWQPSQGDPTPALAGTPHGYRQGLRLRWQPLTGCEAGALQFQHFSAARAPAAATLWARVPAAAADPARPPLRLNLAPGKHHVPGQPIPGLEDQRLFERALALALIQPLPDGRLAMVPADALRAGGASVLAAAGDVKPVFKLLHASANGAFVQAQVRAANQAQHWLAVRLAAVPSGEEAAASAGTNPAPGAGPDGWRASAAGELLSLDHGLPPVAARLFRQPQPGWGEWLRVQAPQTWALPSAALPIAGSARAAAASVAVSDGAAANDTWLELPWPAGIALPVRLQLLGRLKALEGGTLLSATGACDGPGCADPNVVQTLVVQPAAGARTLRLRVVPQPFFNRLSPARSDQLRVQQVAGRWAWIPAPLDAAPVAAPAEVRLLARDGRSLWEDGQSTALARDIGAATAVGIAPGHARSVAGMLRRLGQQGFTEATARLTLEPEHQALLSRVLQCIAGDGGHWLPAAETCQPMPGAPLREPRSIAAAVVLDAKTGDLLAGTTAVPLPTDRVGAELLAFDAFNPQGSPLALHAWQHSGGAAHAPGSTFKLVDALSFEDQARRSPALAAWLAGPGVAAANAQAVQLGKAFDMASPCYPAPCGRGSARVTNFGLNHPEPPLRYAVDGHFGLREALRHSVNTWFSMTAEWQDRTVAAGHADARPLGTGALRAERPLLATLARLGLIDEQRLDGGLLPADFRWQPGDALLASASHTDAITDVHGVRQQALGLRMQTTPLQMARVAASIATGRVVTPRLLLALNGQVAPPAAGAPLHIPVARIQSAMQDTVRMGTAASAFAAPALTPVRHLVHGKTGSAPLASRDDGVDCRHWPLDRPAPTGCLHNAWFVGYLEPGALPGETRTLAFAVQVSHTRGMGGSQAAPVVAAWLQTLWARHARAQHAREAARPPAAFVKGQAAAPGRTPVPPAQPA